MVPCVQRAGNVPRAAEDASDTSDTDFTKSVSQPNPRERFRLEIAHVGLAIKK